MKHNSRALVVTLAIALFSVLVGCGDDTAQADSKLAQGKHKPDAAVLEQINLDVTADSSTDLNATGWPAHVEQHSQGWLPADSSISIRFNHPVIAADYVGKPANDPSQDALRALIKISPELEFTVSAPSDSELLITPSQRLPSGQEFEISLAGKGLKNIPVNLDPYRFHVQVLEQSLQLKISGLVPDSNAKAPLTEKNSMQLSGELFSADTASAEQIEATLTATLDGETQSIRWQHASDGRQHSFTLSNLVRTDVERELILSWQGQALGVKSQGSEILKVPALNQFSVTAVRSVQQPQQYVEVSFSEALDRNQNINGLVQLNGVNAATRVDGGRLRVYPAGKASGELTLTVADSIQSSQRLRLQQEFTAKVTFVSKQPGVRFISSGAILPPAKQLTVPFEAVNVNAVWVTAFITPSANIGQYLQSNQISGGYINNATGRYLWKKKITLPEIPREQWQRFQLDLTELMENHSTGMVNLSLSIDSDTSIFPCSNNLKNNNQNDELKNYEGPGNEQDLPKPEWFDRYYSTDNGYLEWSQRENPCNAAFYAYGSNIRDSRNFMLSNIGLIAKRGADKKLHIVTTDISSSKPKANVEVVVYNYQQQEIGRGKSNSDGMLTIASSGVPFTVKGSVGADVGYLKVATNMALPTSQFDVGGVPVNRGIKGFIYGERDVWRPGDDIYLSFMLQDKNLSLPENYPITLDFFDNKGLKVSSQVNSNPVGAIYTFTLHTDEAAATGNYRAVIRLGGELFESVLKIETITPNRLKLEITPAEVPMQAAHLPLRTEVSAQWLSGPAAKNLHADVELKLVPSKTKFEGYSQYIFDDPAAKFERDNRKVFDGQLDSEGRAAFNLELGDLNDAPGNLRATFVGRVFEPGGEFSKSIRSFDLLPFNNWVGLNIGKGSGYNDAISRDDDHPVKLIAIDSQGVVQPQRKLKLSVYRLGWRWWWDQSEDDIANYIRSDYANRVAEETLSTDQNGVADWTLEKNKYDWGRHLIRICDELSGHCSGKEVYLGWSWSNQLNPDAATQLMLATDKPRYKVGDTATIQIPAFKQGQLLYSLENGSRIIEQRWLKLAAGATSFEIPITAQMAPNVYVNLLLLQPHQARASDAPIRLYGLVPLLVEDPSSTLTPVIAAPEEVRPEGELSLSVHEADGKPMSYTLALVDEGLLGLTGFQTPNPHQTFYRREALGVSSWDMFDGVVGAYGADLERLLRIGGGANGEAGNRKKQRRFPPVVRFLGAFNLAAGETQQHSVTLPQYMGAVRLMVVAANTPETDASTSAYGRAEKTVKVTQPLTLLATLPRVLGPAETVSLPVNVFSSSDKIRTVKVTATATEPYKLLKDSAELNFTGTGDAIAQLQLQVMDRIGMGSVTVVAEAEVVDEAGNTTIERSEQTIHIESRAPNVASSQQVAKLVEPGATWSPRLDRHGLATSNNSALFVSRLPALNLDKRLGYLIRYPHGCLEQTTSAIFPQIQLQHLLELSPQQRDDIQANASVAIKKLRRFQNSDGGFSYWPGESYVNDWASNYATHFLLSAKDQGYAVPREMLDQALGYLAGLASRSGDRSNYAQQVSAYRLYVLALAGRSDLAAMNRLREQLLQKGRNDRLARWQLALAYQKQGLKDIALELFRAGDNDLAAYSSDNYTYGSDLRDLSVRLMLEQSLESELGGSEVAWKDAEQISAKLSNDDWYSTQSLAWGLLALANYSGQHNSGDSNRFSIRELADSSASATPDWQALQSLAPLYRQDIPEKMLDDKPASIQLEIRNDSEYPLYVLLSNTGIPTQGTEQAQNRGLLLEARYYDLDGAALDVTQLQQGQDFVARVKVSANKNDNRFKLEDIALSMVMPSGWQIRNQRLEGDAKPAGLDYQDIRDDRLLSYFSLWRNFNWNYRYGDRNQDSVTVEVRLNATYAGRFYLPGWQAKAMYDEAYQANTRGQWVEVVAP